MTSRASEHRYLKPLSWLLLQERCKRTYIKGGINDYLCTILDGWHGITMSIICSSY